MQDLRMSRRGSHTSCGRVARDRTGARVLESVEAVARRCVAGAIKPTGIRCVKVPSSMSNKGQDTGVCRRSV
jgi:hypothetical protein